MTDKSLPRPARQIWTDSYARGLSDAEVTKRTADIYASSVDPWHLSTEQQRFAETNAAIARRFGRVGRMLEIGCGEGYQTRWLAQLCDHLTGTDISDAALDRARALVPDAAFVISAIPDLPLPAATARFDLAVACEVLYFAPDMRAAIDRMRQLAPRGLVTGLERKWKRFGQAVEGLPGLAIDRITSPGNVWLVATWDG